MNAAASDTIPLHTPDRDALIAEAEAASAAGRFLDAIDLLARANHIDRSTSVEAEMIRLRNLAFDLIVSDTGPDGWPRAMPDPFRDAESPPEISLDRLDSSTLGGAIVNHGCLIVRGFQPIERALELRDQVSAAVDARDAHNAGTATSEQEDRYRPFPSDRWEVNAERSWVEDVGGMLMADAPAIMITLIDLFEDTGFIDAVTDYLGERPSLSFNKCVLRKLRSCEPLWHQDAKFMGDDLRTVDLWLSLSHCGAGAPAPGLDLLPRRVEHLLDTTTPGSTFLNSIGPEVVAAEAEALGAPIITPTFAPGDAIIFDDRFVHRSSAGDGCTEERYAIESWFFAASRFPPGYVPIIA